MNRDYRTTIVAEVVWSEAEWDEVVHEVKEELDGYANVTVEPYGDQGIKISYTVGGNCKAEHHVREAGRLLEDVGIECTKLTVTAEPAQ